VSTDMRHDRPWWKNDTCACEGALIGLAEGGDAPMYIDCPEHKKANRKTRRAGERVWCLTFQITQAAIFAKNRNLPPMIAKGTGKGREHSLVCSTSSFPLLGTGRIRSKTPAARSSPREDVVDATGK
jgi:hypothetical protein